MLFGGNTSKMNAAVRFKNRTTYTLLGIGTHYLDLNDKSRDVYSTVPDFTTPSPEIWKSVVTLVTST
mgnify:FL=1